MSVAAPIARSILLDALDALDIEKPDGGIEKEYQWYDKKYYTVSDVVGMNVKEANKALFNFQVEYSGTGTVVKSMSPEAGSRIAEGAVVRLLLGE